MPLTDLKNARWIYADAGEETTEPAEPTLLLEFTDGKRAFVTAEQKWLFRGIPIAFLDMDFEDVTEATTPPENGQPPQTVKGATDNPAIVQLVREFVAAVLDNNFKPQNLFNHEADLEG